MNVTLKADIYLNDGNMSKTLTEDNIVKIELQEPGAAKLIFIDENELYHCETHKLFDDSCYPKSC